MLEVYLVRHTSVKVEKGRCYGNTDVPLNDSFIQEAEIVKQNLSKLLPFDKTYMSPLTRCVKLATHCGFANSHKDDRIKELNFGDWEMQIFSEIQDPNIQVWYNDFINVRTTNGESFEDQYKRVSNFFDEIKSTYSNDDSVNRIAVFTHGGVLACANVYVNGVIPKDAFSSLAPYGSIKKILL